MILNCKSWFFQVLCEKLHTLDSTPHVGIGIVNKVNLRNKETHYTKGLCYEHQSIDAFTAASKISKNDAIFLQLGKIHMFKEDYKTAI